MNNLEPVSVQWKTLCQTRLLWASLLFLFHVLSRGLSVIYLYCSALLQYPYSTEVIFKFSSLLASTILVQLFKFWKGWEILTGDLEMVCEDLRRSSTCFQSIRQPGHYTEFGESCVALEACIATSDTGFGLVYCCHIQALLRASILTV